ARERYREHRYRNHSLDKREAPYRFLRTNTRCEWLVRTANERAVLVEHGLKVVRGHGSSGRRSVADPSIAKGVLAFASEPIGIVPRRIKVACGCNESDVPTPRTKKFKVCTVMRGSVMGYVFVTPLAVTSSTTWLPESR